MPPLCGYEGRFRPMKISRLSITVLFCLTLSAIAGFAVPTSSHAQSSQMKDDMEQLAMDLHVGMDRSTLTPAQKEQLRDDFKELRRAHQNHEMFASIRAARSIKTVLNSGAFKPEDKERIKQDIQAVKEA